MENFNVEFNEFINEKIESKLNKNKPYLEESYDFENMKNEIYNISSKNQYELFDRLFNVIFSMKSKEFNVAYKVGFNDGIKFSNDFK